MDAAIQKKTELAKTIQAAKLSVSRRRFARRPFRRARLSKERTTAKELLDLYPMVKPVSFIAGFLVEYDAAYREFEKQKAEVTKVRKPSRPSAWCAWPPNNRTSCR